MGLKKVSFERFLSDSGICPQECMKNLFEKLLESVRCEKYFFVCFEKEQVPMRIYLL